MIFLTAETIVLQDGICKMEGGIDQNAVDSAELLRKHSSHRRAQNQVRLARGADIFQHCQCLLGSHRKVRGNDFGLRKKKPHCPYRAVLSAGSESVDVEYFLSGHQVRSCIFEKFHVKGYSR